MSLERSRITAILGLALPIIGAMASQNVLNLVDMLMVGTLGDVALAAVGVASFLHFMCTAMLIGISAGVQAVVARRIGEGRAPEAALPLNGGLLLSVVIGVPLTLALLALNPHVFPLVAGDPKVAEVGTAYLELRLLSIVPLAANFTFRGYFNGVGRSRVYFRTIVLMHTLNALLNYVLIFGKFGFPEMGAPGAGLASTLSYYFGALLYLVDALRGARGHGFLAKVPTRAEIRAMLALSLPTGIQQTFFAAGMTVFFAIIGRVGTREVAASNVLVNLLLVVILPSIGFGLAAATLVGQALGRGEANEARRWGLDVTKVALVGMVLLGLVGALFPELLLAPFLKDPVTRRLAEMPLRVIALSLPIDAVGLVLMQALIGAGHTRPVMVITVGLQWCLNLPLAALVAFAFDGGLTAIWATHFAYRAVQTVLLVREWNRGAWTTRVV